MSNIMSFLQLLVLSGIFQTIQTANLAGYQINGGVNSLLGNSFGQPGVEAVYDYIVRLFPFVYYSR